MAEDWVFTTIRIIAIVSVFVLGIGMIFLARVLAGIAVRLKRLDESFNEIARDARPVLDRARAIGENLNFMVMSVRKEIDRVRETVSVANDRLEDVLESAEDRVQDLGALVDVVQGEVEDTLISTASALRGIRTGAKLLRRKRTDDGSDDEDAAQD